MFVTLNAENRTIQKQKNTSFIAHIKGLNIKDNSCLSQKLKVQFDHHSKDKNNVFLNQKRNTKQFQFLKQECKATNNIVDERQDRNQFMYKNQPKKTQILQNNPQNYSQKLKASLKQLEKKTKIKQSNNTTKDNSRQKSRANSVESSTVCCKFINSTKQDVILPEWKQVVLSSHKTKQTKISKIVSPQITKNTRIIMLDWLFQLSAQIQLPKQALYNCIQYVDKYASVTQVTKTQYQKVGLSCLFLATKLQTSSHPKIHTFLQAMDNQIDRKSLIETQKSIVKKLKFKLNPPTLYQYMTLVLFTVKSFKSTYKNIAWINDLPTIQKGDVMYNRLFWTLDGIIIEGLLANKFQKQQICLSVLYTVILFDKSRQSKLKEDSMGLQQTAFSQYSFSKDTSTLHWSKDQQKDSLRQRLKISYECFMSYATTSHRTLAQLQNCISSLNKWTMHECSCRYVQEDYHEQLRQLASIK